MSIARRTAAYTATAAVVALVVILASTLYVGTGGTTSTTGSSTPTSTTGSSSATNQVLGSQVIVQLTDPPTVPVGTTSLNLTYTSVSLLVGEPGQNGQVAPTTVNVTPQGGSATVDLLKLQNVSQTIASANLPTGSTIYSVTFLASSISAEINGTAHPVTLATGAKSLSVTLLHGSLVQGTNEILLDLTPTVLNTTSGYQMIPSSVGIIKPQSEAGSHDGQTGSQQQVTGQDQNDIHNAQGQVAARIVSLKVTGSTTSITVQVNNTGTSAVGLVAIGLHGNFTVQGQTCSGSTGDQGNGNGNGKGNHGCGNSGQGHNQLVFVPLTSSATTTTSSSSTTTTTTTTSTTKSHTCTMGQMVLVDQAKGDNSQLVLSPGQCIDLTFTGILTVGGSQMTLTPSTAAGQTYTLHVIATSHAETKLGCTLPIAATSCTTVSDHSDD